VAVIHGIEPHRRGEEPNVGLANWSPGK
jgi:hypothetical protein